MKPLRMIRAALVVGALWNLVIPLPTQLLAADPAAPRTRDVQLSKDRQLIGQYVDANGQPIADQQLVLQRGTRTVASAQTDADGQFVFSEISGGGYQLVAEGQVVACRCWAANTAPPGAKPELLIVAPEGVARGQRPIGEVFSNPLLIAALIAGAIAIPIAIHNSGDDGDGS